VAEKVVFSVESGPIAVLEILLSFQQDACTIATYIQISEYTTLPYKMANDDKTIRLYKVH